MKKKTFIQFKAAFLLMVFALNTLVGFACAVGVDMNFNTNHHKESSKVLIHVHADGKKHQHHQDVATQHHNKKDSSKKDDCCNDKVLKLSQTDKVIPSVNIIINPVFFSAFIASHYSIDIFYSSQVSAANKYYVRGYHPPIPDIRIAIQSFQI